jgi:hypothetical protein
MGTQQIYNYDLITPLVSSNSSFYTLIIMDSKLTLTLLDIRMDMRHVLRLPRSLYINVGLQHLISIISYVYVKIPKG